jgi:hypothetical protein
MAANAHESDFQFVFPLFARAGFVAHLLFFSITAVTPVVYGKNLSGFAGLCIYRNSPRPRVVAVFKPDVFQDEVIRSCGGR